MQQAQLVGLKVHLFEERLAWQECGVTPGVLVQIQKIRNIGMPQKNQEDGGSDDGAGSDD